jgi:hypothetical protein
MNSRRIRVGSGMSQFCVAVSSKRFFVCLATLLVVLAAVSSAQTAGTGAIAGTVADSAGAVVAGAAIKVTDVTTGEIRTAVSGPDGSYIVALLHPANYRVEVSKKGFKVSENESIPVHVTETVKLNVELVVGTETEVVNVAANSEALKTEESTLGNVVDETAVNALPLVTRNYTQILGLSPGVSAEIFNAGEIGRGGVDDALVTGGSSYQDNNFQMNGVEIDDLQNSGHYSGGVATPNPDSIQEFKVQTSQYDASYGRDAGASVNVLTKAGSNAWHGSVWEYFRNEDLNANDYFRKQTNQPRGVLRQNQFGFTAGGPILKDKLLFFTSYQGTRQQNGIDPNCSSSVVLPVLTNDRSAAGLAASVDSTTAFGGMDILGRPVDASNVSAQAQALFNLKLPNGQYVVPNPQQVISDPQTGLPEGFSTFSSACPYTENQFITNLDWLQNEKSTIQGRFFYADSQGTFTLPLTQIYGSTLPGAPLKNPQDFRNFSLTHTYTFTSKLVNQAEIGYHRTFSGTDQSFPFSYSDIGALAPAFDNGRPVIQVFGGFNIGGNGQTVILGQNTYVAQDTVSWIRGRHSFRFGGGLTRAQDNMSAFQFAGYAVFANYPGLMLGQAPLNPLATEDFAGLAQRNWRVWDSNAYVQDDIKLTPRLTVNVGFRFERIGDFGEKNGRNATMDPALIDPNPPASGSLNGIVVSSNFPGTRPAGVISSGNDLGIKGVGQNTLNPRVGFAWSIPGTQRVVVRGGYGVYHQRATGQMYLQQISDQPFGLIQVVSPVLTGDFSNPFPPDPGAFPQFVPYVPYPGPTLSPYVLDRNLRPPMFQRYSLGVQTQIARDFVLEVNYVGMRGTHMVLTRDINQASLASASNPIRGETTNTDFNIPLRVPYEGFSAGSFSNIQSTGFAWYNALEATLNKRFSHGLQFLASYTFARDLANVYGSTSGANGGLQVGDNNNPRADYGPDWFVRPQRLVVSAVYALPGPGNRRSLLGEALGGWKLAGVTTIQSGHLLPLLNISSTNAYGALYDFAEVTPGCRIATSGSTTSRLNGWINQNCIAPYPVIGDPEPPGTCLNPDPSGNCPAVATAFGNSRMGILHGPSQVNTDLSIIKQFALGLNDHTNLEFRTEFFNAFNHPIFSDPDIYVSDGPSFGRITSTASNLRIMQFALKLSF